MFRFIVVFLTLIFTSLPAAAQSICAQRADILDKLSNQYSETPTSMGLASNGSILEVFTSPTGNTWTIIVTTPDGVSCLMASGEDWDAMGRIAMGNGA